MVSDREGMPEEMQEAIKRLQKRCVVSVEPMEKLHQWLDGKRLARQPCRVLGDSRTGKSVACWAYACNHPPQQQDGKPPVVPVLYWQAPQESGARDFFEGLLDALQYQLSRGTLSELRRRVYQVLAACQVELLIIDEAHRIRKKTFSDVQDVYEKLEISIALVGTDRLDTVVRRDEQVERRFKAAHQVQRLNSGQLKTTTALWEKHVLRLPEASKLTSGPMQRILNNATDGYIGLLDMILRSAAIAALERGERHITKAILEEVASEYR